MIYSKIVIIHKLPHRMRIFFYHPHFFSERLMAFVLQHPHVMSFEYSTVSNNAVVVFNPLEIDHQNVLGRIIVGLSLNEDSGVVKVHDHTESKNYAGLFFSVIAFAVVTSMEYKKGINKTFYFGAIAAMFHTVVNFIITEGASTAQYKVMTLINPETGEEFYHAEIKEGGQLSHFLSHIMGENDKSKELFTTQIAISKD